MDRSYPSPCPGCGVELPPAEGPVHAYMDSSPACWAVFGEVLAREFEDPAYFAVHQLTVDAYAVQHPGRPQRRTIQSIGMHLMTLCLVFERGADPREGPAMHRRMIGRPAFEWLDPPSFAGRLHVTDVLAATRADEHLDLVRAWAADAWDAWAAHHGRVRDWVDECLSG